MLQEIWGGPASWDRERPLWISDGKVNTWPGSELTRDCRKLTVAGTAIAPKVSLLALPRTHTPGHKRPADSGGFALTKGAGVVPYGGNLSYLRCSTLGAAMRSSRPAQ